MYIGTLAQAHPDKPAAIRPATGESRTFRELDDRSNRLAQLLYAAGSRRGDHVAMYLENHLAFFDVNFACMRSGLYLTPINRYLPASEAAYIVDDCDARVLIASAALDQSEELGRLSPRCEVKLSVGGALPGFEDFDTRHCPLSRRATRAGMAGLADALFLGHHRAAQGDQAAACRRFRPKAAIQR